MAQIPVFQDSQILQPSSPVAIGNANTTLESAIAAGGKEIFELGNTLDQYQRQAKRKEKEYISATAAEEFERRMRLVNADLLTNEKHRDLTAIPIAEKSFQESNKVKTQIVKEFNLGGDALQSFISKSGSKFNELAAPLMADSQKMAMKNYESAKQAFIQTSIAKVFEDPDKIPEEFAKIQQSYAGLPDSINPTESMFKDKRAVVEGALNKYMLEYDNVSFRKAENLLKNTSELFTPEEMQKNISMIRRGRSDYYNELTQKQALQEKEFKKVIEQRQSLLTAELLKKKVEAGTDSKKMALVNASILESGFIGEIDPTQGIPLETAKELAKYTSPNVDLINQRYEGDIIHEAFIKGNYRQMMVKSQNLRKEGKILPSTDVRIQEELGRRLEFMRNRKGDSKLDLGRQAFSNIMNGIDANDALSATEKVTAKDAAYRDFMGRLDAGDTNLPTLSDLNRVASEAIGRKAVMPNADTPSSVQGKFGNEQRLTNELYGTAELYKKARPGTPEHTRLKNKIQNLKLQIQRAREDQKVKGSDNGPTSTGTPAGIRRQ